MNEFLAWSLLLHSLFLLLIDTLDLIFCRFGRDDRFILDRFRFLHRDQAIKLTTCAKLVRVPLRVDSSIKEPYQVVCGRKEKLDMMRDEYLTSGTIRESGRWWTYDCSSLEKWAIQALIRQVLGGVGINSRKWIVQQHVLGV